MSSLPSFMNWGFNNDIKGNYFYTVSEITYWDENINSSVKVISEIDNITNRQVNTSLGEAKDAIDQLRRVAIIADDVQLAVNCDESIEKIQELIASTWEEKKKAYPEGIVIEVNGWDFHHPYRIEVVVLLSWEVLEKPKHDEICYINIMDNESEAGLPYIRRLHIVKRQYKELYRL